MINEPDKIIRIVVVEDHDEIRNGIVFILSACENFRCAAFKTGEEALSSFKTGAPDVVVMDIHLPGISGIECTRRIRQLYPATLVLMCTVLEDNARIFEALKAGASGYILKHTAGEALIQAVKELLKGGSPMSSEIARKVVSSFRSVAAQEADLTALTSREADILELLSAGYGNKEIACRLCVSVNTVRTHIHHIYEKLHVHNRIGALNIMQRSLSPR